MRKVLPVKLTESRLYVDFSNVQMTYVSKAEMLSDIASKSDHFEANYIPDNIQLYNLEKLLGLTPNTKAEELKVILIDDAKMVFGLLVPEFDEVCDIDDNMFRIMPHALSDLCRDCFPFVIIEEKSVVPVINPLSIPLLNKQEEQESVCQP